MKHLKGGRRSHSTRTAHLPIPVYRYTGINECSARYVWGYGGIGLYRVGRGYIGRGCIDRGVTTYDIRHTTYDIRRTYWTCCAARCVSVQHTWVGGGEGGRGGGGEGGRGGEGEWGKGGGGRV
jgi:hypothetical protein